MSNERTLEYQPALDGLRAVAVTMVLLFHGGVNWMKGGYIGVSVFFTLSGYLITNLLLTEHSATGSIRLGRFYARRMKRLLPASTLCLLVVVVARMAGAYANIAELRRDVLGALFQVANWVKLLGDASYADLVNATLGRSGPLEHYWSLAIEEQFYWIWPLLMIVMLNRAKRPSVVRHWLLVFALLGAAAAPLVAWRWGADAAYWATPARVGEILTGAGLAGLLHRRPTEHLRQIVVPPIAPLLGSVAGSIVVLWAAITWPSDSGPAYQGWLPVFSLATVALIWGLQHRSWLRSALSARPVVWVGTVSYGIYLYHWPIFVALSAERTGLSGSTLLVVRLAATLFAATVSSRLVELPVRRSAPLPARTLALGAAATVAMASFAGIVVADTMSVVVADDDLSRATIETLTGTLAPLTIDEAATTLAEPVPLEPAATVAETVGSGPTRLDDVSPVAIPNVSRPVRIVIVGDSTAQATAVGVVDWAVDHPDSASVTVEAAPGCGLIRGGRVPTDGSIDFKGRCDALLDHELPAIVEATGPDVAILMVTMRDVEDRIWSDAEGPLTPFDEQFRARMLADYRAISDRLLAGGVRQIAWVLPPRPIAPFQGEQRKMRDPERYRVQFSVIEELAADRPDSISVVDLHGWLDERNLIVRVDMRPDGLHWTPEASRWVAETYLLGTVFTLLEA